MSWLEPGNELHHYIADKMFQSLVQKFDGTGVIFTVNPYEVDFVDGVVNFTDTIGINSISGIKDSAGDLLGIALPNENVVYINYYELLHNIEDLDLLLLAEQFATLIAHEVFHLSGIPGHSTEGVANLMSPGEITAVELVNNGGVNLHFTDIQKAILRGDVVANGGMTLSEVEQNMNGFISPQCTENEVSDALKDLIN